MFPKLLTSLNPREHLAIYLLATVSNLLLSIAEYMAVHSAALSYVPVSGGSAGLITTYGVGLGLALDFFWTLFVYQTLLAVILLILMGSALIDRGWRFLYIFMGMFVSGFVGYWIGVKFLRTLGWVSILQNAGVNNSDVYSDLFWFGFGATICYVAMILVLRRSYDELVKLKTVSLVKRGPS